jgi:predicted NAD/FAD-binding protein
MISKKTKITLYEKSRIGGHSFTHDLGNGDKVDIGFQVFNKNTYPNMLEMFDELELTYDPRDIWKKKFG